MTAEEICQTKDEYKAFSSSVFERRVQQEICLQKMKYFLEWKRAKKSAVDMEKKVRMK